MENALTQLIQTQTQQAQSLQALQDAITTLGQHLVKPERPTEPSKVLTKQTGEDDIEAYLEVFERTAERERWPRAQWAGILAPFLIGEAQKACRDLSPADVNQYGALKAAILAHYGHNLQTRAQQFHAWEYDATAPVRPQIATLMRLTRSWLTSGEGPPAIDRVAMDRCIRALPGGAKRHASQSCPETVDALVTLLENHQVTVQLMQSSRPPSQSDPRRDRQRLRKSDTEALGPSPRPQGGPPQPSLQRRPFVNPDRRKCFACGQEGHIAWNCPGEDILMPTAGSSDSPRKADSYLTTCWAHEGARAPKLPVRIGTQDAEALLDSGSAVTLLRPGLTSGPRGPPIPVSCVHGDSREYPTTHIKVQTTRGTFEVVAGLVENLPVPVLIGRDCPIFWRLWACRTAGHRRNCPTKKPGRDQKVKVAHACAAPSSPTTSSAEGTEEEAPAPAEAPTRRDPRLTEGSSNEAFSEFPLAEEASSTRPGQFGTAQWEDPNLEQARQNLAVVEGEPVAGVSASTFPHFSIKNGLLYRVAKLEERVVEQLLVPKRYINKVLYLAHSHLLGAHLGVEKTYDRVRERFYWPGVKKAVQDYCQICPQCQKTAPKVNYQNPLIPLPIIDIPFQRVAMDIVGPLPKSSRGHRFILVIMDYATRYPEAVPLRTASAKAVARELFLLFSRVGIAKEVLTDQGTCFMSRVMKEMCKLLKVSQIRTSVYHPQTDGLVERFNKTLKQMLRKAIDVEGKNWDQLIPFVLFSIREVPQASTGFSPFELLYGRRPRGMLDLAKEAWEQQPSAHRSAIEYVDQMQDRMAKVWPLVREHMQQAQHAQARIYNRRAQLREFQPGEFVLVLIPTVECKFLAKWHGPYEVIERVGEVNYKVRQPGRRKICQIYHINLLKRWHAPDSVPMAALTTETQDRVPSQVPLGPHLSPTHRQDMVELTGQFKDVFSDMPGRTTVINHDIITEPGKKVRLRPYRIPEAKRETIKEEVRRMLEMGVIEESHSAWSSPIVLTPKPDGSERFCNDFRKLNEISKFDAYPMPRVDELIERLGPARFVSTLDLTKGYWQVPLTETAKEKTAFATPEGLYHYRVLPFGVHGAPATFQRMMDQVLRPHREYAAAYLDDVVIHSPDWTTHVGHLKAVLGSLRRAGLTANPKKCHLGLEEAEYLGYTIGRGSVRPQSRKVEAIATWPKPATKRQVKTFLGLVGYYQCFIPHFATIAAPLHEMTKNSHPHQVLWTTEAEAAFTTLRRALCTEPILSTPNFEDTFIVHTDASGSGLGAVLSQVRGGEEHPVTYISRQGSGRHVGGDATYFSLEAGWKSRSF
uniref:uncharacterized protein LOC120834693 isoform X2 n=1 Tax=Gasterosteus aculeatus aculeatus TaxID=481459 RepID=UPI001A97EBB6|nr:uncharacterized protein LOC120834693 isoform X2 [Gasterosteus aculeatus aculeatus]